MLKYVHFFLFFVLFDFTNWKKKNSIVVIIPVLHVPFMIIIVRGGMIIHLLYLYFS